MRTGMPEIVTPAGPTTTKPPPALTVMLTPASMTTFMPAFRWISIPASSPTFMPTRC